MLLLDQDGRNRHQHPARKVSRGSFYWYFKDIGDFRAQLLRTWQERSTDRVIRQLEADKAQPDRLGHLMKRAFTLKRDLDRAVRARPRAAFMYWAHLGQAIVMDARYASIAVAAIDDISGLLEK